MASVTVPGTGQNVIASTFDNSNNSLLAQRISDAIAAANTAGKFLAAPAPAPGSTIAPPSSAPGFLDEMVISVGGSYKFTPAPPGGQDWLVAIETTDAVTITGGPNTTVFGGGGPLTVIDPGLVTVAEGADATVNLTAADTGVVVAGNNSNDTLSAGGANDTIFAGTGSNLLSASGNGDVLVGNTGFNTTITGANTYNVSGAGDTVMTGAGVAVVTTSGRAAQVFGGSAATTVTTSGTADSIFGGTGNTLILAGDSNGSYFMGPSGVQEFANIGGSGTVFAGAGSPSVFGSFGSAPGSDEVFGGSGALTLATGGSNDTVFAGSGSATIFGAFGGTIGNDVIFGGAGILEVVTGGSNDTVFGGTSAGQTVFGGFDPNPANNGNSVINSGPNAMVIDTAGSSDTIHAGLGNDTLWFGTGAIAGNNLVFGGSGNLRAQFVGGAGSATIIGGSGNATVFGNAGSDITFQGSQGGVTMIALGPVGAGNGETLNAGSSTTNNMLEAVSGSISVVGGAGNDTLVGGVTDNDSVTGSTTMTGGAGDNLFFFQHGNVNGTDIVTDFAASAGNVFAISGYDALVGGGPQSAANAALAGATFSGGNTSITLADGTQITFDNTTVAQLQGHITSS